MVGADITSCSNEFHGLTIHNRKLYIFIDICSCIYILSQCVLLLLEGIIINWYLSVVDMT